MGFVQVEDVGKKKKNKNKQTAKSNIAANFIIFIWRTVQDPFRLNCNTDCFDGPPMIQFSKTFCTMENGFWLSRALFALNFAKKG